jgi:hypothetical protein
MGAAATGTDVNCCPAAVLLLFREWISITISWCIPVPAWWWIPTTLLSLLQQQLMHSQQLMVPELSTTTITTTTTTRGTCCRQTKSLLAPCW